MKDYAQHLNMFPSVSSSNNENNLIIQRISTILFIFLWVVSLTILLLYTSLIIITKTITVERPSLIDYSHLNSIYSQTLTCPCSSLSIEYGKFLHVDYTLHQVCSSAFVNETWVNYLYHPSLVYQSSFDFRRNSPQIFQTLSELCKLINSTISSSLIRFYLNEHVSAFVIPQQLLKLQTESLAHNLRSSMANTFSLSITMIQNTTQANALFSKLGTNYFAKIVVNKSQMIMNNVFYGSCDCAISSSCFFTTGIYSYNNPIPSFIIPGLYLGCYVFESLLRSTLECFYDESCFNQLKIQLQSNSSIDVTALNALLPTRYSVDSPIQELVDNLMIEEWNVSTMYESYYNKCQPTQCSYTVWRRNDVIDIVTILFGVTDGLTMVLKFIVPKFVIFVMSLMGTRRMTVMPEIVAVPT